MLSEENWMSGEVIRSDKSRMIVEGKGVFMVRYHARFRGCNRKRGYFYNPHSPLPMRYAYGPVDCRAEQFCRG